MHKNPWERRRSLFTSPVPKNVKKPKAKWRILPILWKAFKKTSTVVGAFVIISSIIISWTLAPVMEQSQVTLPKRIVMYMELDGKLGELPSPVNFVDPFTKQNITLKNYIDAIYKAKEDPRVKGIYAKVKGGHYAITHVQELRQAIIDFRKGGKFAYIYAPSYSGGLGSYYLASAFDERWMQPMGNVMIPGLNAEMPFLRDVLDKIGVKPQFMQRKEYKTAYENLSRSEMSKPNEIALAALVNDIAGVITADISNDLGIEESKFKALVDKGLLVDEESLKAKLIDHIEYEDVLWDKIREEITGDVDSPDQFYVDIERYIGDMKQQKSTITKMRNAKEPRVALIYAVGAIMDSDSDVHVASPFIDDGIAAADDISDALMEAAEDDTIKAVVLRIDSPGGSPVASETILRAVRKVQEKEKPVIVSMGAAAASGGYWISAYGNHIFASPTTITGSIGVVGGKISAKDLWEKIGVNWDGVQWGDHSAMFSMNEPFSKSEAERMNAMLDNVYENFINRVAEGRDMSKEEVEQIARGRVWSGLSAHEVGLVDDLGGLNDAFDFVAKGLGAQSRDELSVVILPKPMTPIEQFVALLEGQVRASQIIGAQAGLIESAQPWLRQLNVMSKSHNSVVHAPLDIK